VRAVRTPRDRGPPRVHGWHHCAPVVDSWPDRQLFDTVIW